MERYTYLLVDILTISVCFGFSFHHKIRFDRQFVPFLKAAAIVAIPFIAWDIWFTDSGVWWFNTDYTLGITLFGLPVEEWLFFFCIPFSCIFTYYCFDKFFKLDGLAALNNTLVFASIIICAVVVLLTHDSLYTLVTGSLTVFTLIFMHFIAKKTWIAKASLVFLILMLGFFPVNGVLTGTGLSSPIVNYNPDEFLGIRLFTIPIEDAVYGYTQFLWIIFLFDKFEKTPDYEY